MNRCRKLALASAMLLQAGTSFSQGLEEEELALAYGDKATVSLATGTAQPLRRAPAVASVITAEDIAAMGATDLDEVLETVAGVHVSRSAIAYAPLYFFRGIGVGNAYNPEVLMLQNGVPMTSSYSGDRGNMWGGLPVENIARIEVIRGPGSALYGADAYSGVINIVTKSAADIQGTHFGTRLGSFDSGSAWVQHGGKLGGVDVAAYLRIGTTDGFKEKIEQDGQSRLDSRFGTRASLAPGSVNTGVDSVDAGLDLGYEKWRFRAGYKLRDNLETAAGVSSALDPVSKMKSERFNGDLSWNDAKFTENWGLGFTGSFFQLSDSTPNGLQLLPPGATIAGRTFTSGMIGGPSRSERQVRLSAFATYNGFENHSLRFGMGHDDIDLYETATRKNFITNAAGTPVPTDAFGRAVFSSPVVIDYNTLQPHILPQHRKVNYLFVQDEWHFARDWTLTAGVRRDSYSDFGATTNPRFAVVWDAALDLTVKLMHGRAFRAPSFSEQYGINPVSNGNPNLRPETIATTEAAFTWQARKDLQVNLSLFTYGMKDIIRAVPDVAGGVPTTFQNAGNQTGRGAELEATWDATRTLRLTGNYAYQHSVDKSTNTDPGYAPRNHFYGRADWRFSGDWMASTQVNHVADRKRAFGDTRPNIPDYTTVDLTLRTTRSQNQWNFAASVRNLFDANAREPSLVAAPFGAFPTSQIPGDLPLARRSFYLQALYKM